jgi:hypothetical protein
MHDILSARLARLTNTAASPQAQKSLKSDLLDLAKLCQVVPQNDFLLDTVAGPLVSAVKSVFGAAALIVVLTETSRRQVYFAVLARLQAMGGLAALATDDAKRQALVERLLLARSEDLIASAYGACPRGFVRLLARLGDPARRAGLYADLFTLVSDAPDLARELLAAARGEGLSDNLVELMMVLPRAARSVRLARLFDDKHDLERFLQVYRFLTGEENLLAEHSQRLCRGERPDRLLDSLYLALPFPDPVICTPGLRHVRNGEDLVTIAKTFRNCLGNFVAEGLRGDHQYYIWSRASAPEVVVCIRHEAPFGWYLAECQLADNERVPPRLKKDLKALLAHCGIRTTGSVENLMRPYRNGPDEIDLDLVFDLDAA